jgi:hypothetical protein
VPRTLLVSGEGADYKSEGTRAVRRGRQETRQIFAVRGFISSAAEVRLINTKPPPRCTPAAAQCSG